MTLTRDNAAAGEPTTPEQRIADELELMRTAGIIEVAVRNPNVAEYMTHWEGRATKAEAALLSTMAKLDEAEAAQAALVERAAEIVDPPLMHRKGKVGLWRSRRAAMANEVRALAPTAGVETLANLRAERDKFDWHRRKVIGENENLLNGNITLRDKLSVAEAERDRLAAANAQLEARVAGLEEACAPFKAMSAEMFARNWNRDQVAIALDNPSGMHRLTFGDFLDLHAALAAYGKEPT